MPMGRRKKPLSASTVDEVVAGSKATPTLPVLVNSPLRRGTKIHDGVFQALHDLGADYVR